MADFGHKKRPGSLLGAQGVTRRGACPHFGTAAVFPGRLGWRVVRPGVLHLRFQRILQAAGDGMSESTGSAIDWQALFQSLTPRSRSDWNDRLTHWERPASDEVDEAVVGKVFDPYP